MDDLAEFESWHEDFMAWERFQDDPFQNLGSVPQSEHTHVKKTDIKNKKPQPQWPGLLYFLFIVQIRRLSSYGHFYNAKISITSISSNKYSIRLIIYSRNFYRFKNNLWGVVISKNANHRRSGFFAFWTVPALSCCRLDTLLQHVATKSDSYSLLCSFFHIPAFHSNLRQAGDLQTEGCRHLSVILTFHLLRCLTRLYVNPPITDSSGRKYADRRITLPQHLPNAIIWSSYFGVLFSLSLARFCKYLLFKPIYKTSNYRLLAVR